MEEPPATGRLFPSTFSIHLLPMATLAFCGGITAAQEAAIRGLFLLWPAALLAALLTIFAGKNAFLHRLSTILLCSFFFLIGIIHAQPYLTPPPSPDHVANIITTRREATIIGTLVQAPSIREDPFSGKRTKLLVSVDHYLFPPNDPGRSSPSVPQKMKGLVRFTLNGEADKKIIPGTRLAVRARLSPTHSFGTPGAFDFQTYLARQGIRVTGWITSPADILSLGQPQNPDRSLFSALKISSERLRHRISFFIDTHLDSPASGLYKAILIGEKSAIPPPILENFIHTGSMHLLAISGLHLGLLALFFHFLFYWLLKKSSFLLLRIPVKKAAALLTIIPLTGYAFIAGLNIPVVRALLMAAAVILTLLLDRQKSLVGALSLAALFILIMAPQSLFTASFQLSFGAVLAVAVFSIRFPQLFNFKDNQPNALNRRAKTLQWLLSGLLLSTIIVIGIAPILAYHFHRISLLGPLATIIIEPLLCIWSLTIGLAAIAFIHLSPPIATFLLKMGSLGLLASERMNEWLAHILPRASLWMPAPTLTEILFYYLFLFALFYLRNKQRTLLALSCILAIFIQEASIQILRSSNKITTVNFLDVGQGSAAVLEFPGGRTVLIDGGGPTSSRLNVGRDIIAPFLWKNRILKLNGVVVTHPHADHFNGLEFIIDHFRPETLWTNGELSANRDFQRLLQRASTLEIKHNVPIENAMLLKSGETTLLCLSSPVPDKEKNISESDLKDRKFRKYTNRNSLVLQLKNNRTRYIFPGDIDRVMEKNLIDRGFDLTAEVLLSPHHGSTGSNSKEFLAAVAPEYLVVSSGGHPSTAHSAQRIKKISKENGAFPLFTFQSGAITCTDAEGGPVCRGYVQ